MPVSVSLFLLKVEVILVLFTTVGISSASFAQEVELETSCSLKTLSIISSRGSDNIQNDDYCSIDENPRLQRYKLWSAMAEDHGNSMEDEDDMEDSVETLCTVFRPELGIHEDSVQESVCDELELEPAIRPSMFSFFPPFINFCAYDQVNQELPLEVAHHLRWNYTAYTSNVISSVVIRTGYTMNRFQEDTAAGNWGLRINFATLAPWQKVGKVPNARELGNKYRLSLNLRRLKQEHEPGAYDFVPTTFSVPDEMEALQKMADLNPSMMWIYKPRSGARGNGVVVLRSFDDIPETEGLVQEYIQDPLLINGLKVDLRLYVLMTSSKPLKLYMFNNGLVRFATKRYRNEKEYANQKYMHMTNHAINRNNKKYKQNDDPKAEFGHKWTLNTLWKKLATDGVDVEKLQEKITDVVIKTFIAGEMGISSEHSKMKSRYNAYEIFGVDILLDSSLQPWLLEINQTPTLNASSLLDLSIKGDVVREMFNIVGYHIPSVISLEAEEAIIDSLDVALDLETAIFDERIYNMTVNPAEERKQRNFIKKYTRRKEYLDAILENLTGDDVRQLMIAEEELSQAEGFQRIFPTASTFKYLRYFEKPRYGNLLMDAWETKYGNRREDGILLLQELANNKLHLM